MSGTRYILIAMVLAVFGATAIWAQDSATQQARDDAPRVSDPARVVLNPNFTPPTLGTQVALLYDNGPLINGNGTGVGGADESILQSVTLGMNTLGFGHQILNDNRMADDFTVSDPGGWNVDSLVFFAYQTNSPTTSTITQVYYQVWDGDPSDPNSTVVFGDLATNRLIHTVWSNIYRVSETTTGTSSARPIMTNTVSGGFTLPAGTYWLVWQTDGSLASGPWAPPITINGQATTGNGMQYIGSSGTWGPANDSGSLTQQGLPFLIYGDVAGGPPADKLLLSELVVRPSDAEYVEIYNPNGTAVDLTNYYLTDATFQGGNTFYYQIVEGGGGGGGFADWHARFPAGATIGAGEYQTIAMNGAGFVTAYGVPPTYELWDTDPTITDMLEAFPGSINNQGGFTNSDEVCILYNWDGQSDLVGDVDYVIYDDGGNTINEQVDKTGVRIDGPDAGTDSSAYLPDTPILSQVPAPVNNTADGFSTSRIDFGEGNQTTSGGNGVTGSDETSEDLNNTWSAYSVPSPNGPWQRPAFSAMRSATLSGDQEVPPVVTGGTGSGEFELSADSTAIWYNVTVSGLTGLITAAHFHNAPAGSNGPVVRTISGATGTNGATFQGVWRTTDSEPLTPALVDEFLAGNLYINVHTDFSPSGEVRGQIVGGGPALADFDVCYGSLGTQGPNAGALITIDPTTGAGTLVGPSGLAGVPAIAIKTTGEMFATDVANPASLYRIDAATGAATLIANTGLFFPDALAFDANDVLYAVDSNNNLQIIDEVTGTTTLIGPVGANIRGLATDPTTGVLWGSEGGGTPTDGIYTIDVNTGAATLVGLTGLGGPTPDIHFDQAGNLFGSKGGGANINDLISIDKTTGAGTVIGSIGFQAVSGLATRLQFGAPVLNPPRNLSAQAGDGVVDLTWDAPLAPGVAELFYDDGTAEGNLSIGSTGEGDLAVRFTPNVYPSTVMAIRVFFADAPTGMTSIDWTIWDGTTAGPGTALATGTQSINRGDFDVVDVSGAGVQITADDFFISYFEPNGQTMNLSWDTDSPPSADRSWVNAPALGFPWQTLRTTGIPGFDNDLMIRALVLEGSGPSARVVELAPDGESRPLSIAEIKALQQQINQNGSDPRHGEVHLDMYISSAPALPGEGHLSLRSGSTVEHRASLPVRGNELHRRAGRLNSGALSSLVSSGLNGYNVYRSEDGVNFATVGSVDSLTLNFSDNTVTNGTTYWYFVTAVYSEGESSPSDTVQATPGAVSEPLMSLTHTPGDLNVGIFNDGSIGAENVGFTGPGVTWKGQNGLFVGGPMFGTSGVGSVNGLIGSFTVNGDIINVSSNFAGGFTTAPPDFDQVTSAILDDSGAPVPYGVQIVQRSYSNTAEEQVFIRYGFVNTTASTLTDFYAGIFIDWDIDANTFGTNSGGYALDRNLVYQFDTSGTPYYYGVAALDGLSGYKTTTLTPTPDVRSGSFTWISTPDADPIGAPGDFRSWQGAGSVSIAPGDTAWFTFAIVAGDDLNGIRANALNAAIKSAALGWTGPVGIDDPLSGVPQEFALEQNYPNPFNPTTTLKYALKANVDVSLKIYNVLGQLVKTLVNEKQTAGFKEVVWDGTNDLGQKVASGIYVYRLEAQDFVKSRKMILLK